MTKLTKTTQTFIGCFFVLISLLLTQAFIFKSTREIYQDPIPNAVDDEKTIITTRYGLVPLVYKQEVGCYCASFGPGRGVYWVNVSLSLLGAVAVSYVLSRTLPRK